LWCFQPFQWLLRVMTLEKDAMKSEPRELSRWRSRFGLLTVRREATPTRLGSNGAKTGAKLRLGCESPQLAFGTTGLLAGPNQLKREQSISGSREDVLAAAHHISRRAVTYHRAHVKVP
jgi:hypothetical protein